MHTLEERVCGPCSPRPAQVLGYGSCRLECKVEGGLVPYCFDPHRIRQVVALALVVLQRLAEQSTQLQVHQTGYCSRSDYTGLAWPWLCPSCRGVDLAMHKAVNIKKTVHNAQQRGPDSTIG